jgi:CCR4-NOT transcription complex subunit 1 TTP binding domain/KH domain
VLRQRIGTTAMTTPEETIKQAWCEEAANSLFSDLFKEQHSVPETIDRLHRLQSSSDAQERAIFDNCMRAVFDQYPVLHKYGKKELQLMGTFFGAAIQAKLVGQVSTPVALRLVLESLKMQPGPGAAGKMFSFGLSALQQFKTRWEEWPMYCSNLLQVRHLAANHPGLVADLREAARQDRKCAPTSNDVAPKPEPARPIDSGTIMQAHHEERVASRYIIKQLHVPSKKLGYLIGSGGATIQAVSECTNTYVRVSSWTRGQPQQSEEQREVIILAIDQSAVDAAVCLIEQVNCDSQCRCTRFIITPTH